MPSKSLDSNLLLLSKDIGKQIDIDIENSNNDADDDDDDDEEEEEEEEENEIDLDDDEDDDEDTDLHNMAYQDVENLNITNDEHHLVIEREPSTLLADRLLHHANNNLKQQLKSVCIITANAAYKNNRNQANCRMDSTLLDESSSLSKLKLGGGESSYSSSESSSKTSLLTSATTPAAVNTAPTSSIVNVVNNAAIAVLVGSNSTKKNLQQFNSSHSSNSLISNNSSIANNLVSSSSQVSNGKMPANNTSTITASTSNSINDDASEVSETFLFFYIRVICYLKHFYLYFEAIRSAYKGRG